MKNILIAPAHYQVYRSASRRLVRRLGSAAPTAEQLIQHELSQRTPGLIADEYLESWRRAQERPTHIPDRLSGLKVPTAVDPGRN